MGCLIEYTSTKQNQIVFDLCFGRFTCELDQWQVTVRGDFHPNEHGQPLLTLVIQSPLFCSRWKLDPLFVYPQEEKQKEKFVKILFLY